VHGKGFGKGVAVVSITQEPAHRIEDPAKVQG
jgi:hypothetical protein